MNARCFGKSYGTTQKPKGMRGSIRSKKRGGTVTQMPKMPRVPRKKKRMGGRSAQRGGAETRQIVQYKKGNYLVRDGTSVRWVEAHACDSVLVTKYWARRCVAMENGILKRDKEYARLWAHGPRYSDEERDLYVHGLRESVTYLKTTEGVLRSTLETQQTRLDQNRTRIAELEKTIESLRAETKGERRIPGRIIQYDASNDEYRVTNADTLKITKHSSTEFGQNFRDATIFWLRALVNRGVSRYVP